MKELMYRHYWVMIGIIQALLLIGYSIIRRLQKKSVRDLPVKKTDKRTIILRIVKSLLILVYAWSLYLYPAIITLKVATSQEFDQHVLSDYFLCWFNKVSRRYEAWSEEYLKHQGALSVSQSNVPATEWPVFGSTFYLLTAEEIKNHIGQRNDELAIETRKRLAKGSEQAVKIIFDPATAHWVRLYWGEDYLTRENVFYRMLLIMGLSSYQTVTGKNTYQGMLAQQTDSLANELLAAPHHLLDDYPGECWPNDVVWAVAAIRRADKILGSDHSLLAKKLMRVLDNTALSDYGVPLFKVNSRTLAWCEVSRGCANSAISIFAPELDVHIAQKWYDSYEKHFLLNNDFVVGFREFPFDDTYSYSDVDSGPVIFGFGSVASLFGIGSANTMGRFDRAIPMTKELIVLSWPTPFGSILPSVGSWLGTRSSALGEIAMLFSITRTNLNSHSVSYSGKTPGIVWAAFACYLFFGIYHLLREFFIWQKLLNGIK